MATGTTTEIMMQFIDDKNKAVPAECTTFIGANDKLAMQDVAGFADGFAAGCYFLIDSFQFDMELNDGESKQSKGGGGDDALLKHMKKSNDPAVAKLLKNLGTAGDSNRFLRWRSAEKWSKGDDDAPPYNAHVEDFTFTRRIDKASVSLFKFCSKQTSFPFASLIKRKSAAVVHSDTPENQSYLRIDFANVQIASFKWSDDDVLEETCAFRASKMQIQYWAQGRDRATGTENVLTPLNAVTWENKVAKAGNQV